MRLASQRTELVLKRLKVLGNCANKSYYDYTPDQIKKIFNAIEEEVRVVKAKFKTGNKTFEFHE